MIFAALRFAFDMLRWCIFRQSVCIFLSFQEYLLILRKISSYFFIFSFPSCYTVIGRLRNDGFCPPGLPRTIRLKDLPPHQGNNLNCMKTITKHTLYVLFSLLPVCRAMPEDAPRSVPLELWYDEPAVEWMTSALPLGNGDLGAMFFGGVARADTVQREEPLVRFS